MAFEDMDSALRNNREIALQVVTISPIQYSSLWPALQVDKEIALLGARDNMLFGRIMPRSLLDDKKFIFELLHVNPTVYCYLTDFQNQEHVAYHTRVEFSVIFEKRFKEKHYDNHRRMVQLYTKALLIMRKRDFDTNDMFTRSTITAILENDPSGSPYAKRSTARLKRLLRCDKWDVISSESDRE
jgi:hypothetical protein